MAGLHPTALYEIAGLLALHGVVSRADARFSAPLVLGGIGALRLLIDPLRAAPPLGAPLVPPAAIAAGWLAVGGRPGLAPTKLEPPVETRQRDKRCDGPCDSASVSAAASRHPDLIKS